MVGDGDHVELTSVRNLIEDDLYAGSSVTNVRVHVHIGTSVEFHSTCSPCWQ